MSESPESPSRYSLPPEEKTPKGKKLSRKRKVPSKEKEGGQVPPTQTMEKKTNQVPPTQTMDDEIFQGKMIDLFLFVLGLLHFLTRVLYHF